MVLSLIMAVISFTRAGVPGAKVFLFGNIGAFFYAVGSLIEITSVSMDQVTSALTVEYLGIAAVGPLWYLTILSATRGAWTLSRGQMALLFAVPALIVVSVATNSYHHLFYSSISLEHRGPFTVPLLGKGPLYMVNMVYMNTFLFLGTMTALQEALRASQAHRTPLLLLFGGGLMPWGGMAVYQLGWSPWGLDIAPFGMSLSAIVFAVALFRYRLFDLMPLVVDQVFLNMKEGVMVLDTKGRLIGINPAMTALIPDMTADLVGRELSTVAAAAPLLGNSPDVGLVVNGSRRVFQIERSPLCDRNQKTLGQILLLSDVTVREELMARLTRVARTDELTDLPNRRSFLERMRSEAERHRRHGRVFAVALADLDHFKEINDRWGHEAGDAALVHVAQLWSSCLRSSDLLARYGGEEFTLLMTDTDAPVAGILLERMRALLESQPLLWGDQEVRLTASFGLAAAGIEDHDTTEGLLRRADEALYRAKESGRNRVEKEPF